MPQIALAWILANDAVTSVIIGAQKVAQLDDNLKSIDVALTADDLKALDEASKLTPEYPAWMDSLGIGSQARREPVLNYDESTQNRRHARDLRCL